MLLQSLLRPVLTPIMRGIFDPALCVSAAWTPTDLASLGAWFDPSDLSTMFQDAAGTTPVTAAGQPVGLILDKSGNGHHASQSTSTARPLFQIDGSGNAHLVFDGVDDYLSTAAIDLTGTDKVTVFIGIQSDFSGTNMIYTIPLAYPPANGFCAYGEVVASTHRLHLSMNGDVYYDDTASKAENKVLTHVYDRSETTFIDQFGASENGGVMSLTANGAVLSTGNFGNQSLYFPSASYPLNGNIYSLIIGGALYDAETVLAAETWVADKTGVTL
jgi:hypothetical protein